jgi:uncharacterized protein (DUF2235 family)
VPPRDWIRRLLGRAPQVETAQPPRLLRGSFDHVVIVDGTMSSLSEGFETNAGLTWKLLSEIAQRRRMVVRYEPGIQWSDWHGTLDVIEGRGINRLIERVYGHLASRYHEGDRLWLFGYSRGAYAVRALAGMIDRIGLLHTDHATVRNIVQAWRHYSGDPDSVASRAFAQAHCHQRMQIEMIGCWDTVKALGIRAPLLWRYSRVEHRFHNLTLGESVRRGRHALALDETRDAFAPVMWETGGNYPGELIQMWFRGTHGDVGGQLGGFFPARPLANIPLVWMLSEAEAAGLPLPEGWRDRYQTDLQAPSVGSIAGWGKLFLLRHRRIVGHDPSEQIHPTARDHPVLLSG